MIYLIDSNKNEFGHNKVYLNELSKIKKTKVISLDINLVPNDANIIKFLINRFCCFKKQQHSIKTSGIQHFLHADLYYPVPWLRKLYTLKKKVVLTMHYYPNGRIKEILVKNFCRKASCIIVHSKFLKEKYKSLGIRDVECIEYPSFYDYSNMPNKLELKKQWDIEGNIVLSALGGTRYEKGLDILINAIAKLPNEIKSKIVLNIAGKGLDFDIENIKQLVQNTGIKTRLTIRGMSEQEFMENVVVSDYIMIPYRKNFNGNSGPMTEAIVNDIPCIVADHGNLGYITEEENIGVTFISEDINDLSRVISKEIKTPSEFAFKNKKKLTKEAFLNGHVELYRRLLGEKFEERNFDIAK